MGEVQEETLEPGAEVAGYQLVRPIGEGGMGVVWAARHLADGTRVALKFLREGEERDPRRQERFLREARAAMAVAHPNVARVLAVRETGAGVPFLAMELLEGSSLREVLERKPALSPTECAHLLLPVVDAVAAAHATGIVHRDLKPENVFLAHPPGVDPLAAPASVTVKVLDFGIAKRMPRSEAESAPSLTSTGALIGTPFYMAPEQIFGDDDIDGRADVWALGIVLYECLAGKRPTDVEGFGPIIKRITVEPLAPIEHARPGLPPALPRLVARMLTRERDARPTLPEVRDVLARIVDGTDVEPAPNTVPLPHTASGGTAFLAPVHAPGPLNRAPPHGAPPAVAPAARLRPGGPSGRVIAVAIAGFVGVLAVVTTIAQVKKLEASAAPARPTVRLPPVNLPRFDASAGDPRDPVNLLRAASAREAERDGRACLRHLDAFDASPGRGALPPTHDPASGHAAVRAQCLMLTGDCEGGKSLYRRWLPTHGSPAFAGETAEDALDGIVARKCEGDALAPRDALLRAASRLDDVRLGQRTPTRAECKEWHATVRRLASTVKPRSPNDSPLTAALGSADDSAVRCFAVVGECVVALEIHREHWNRTIASPGLAPPLRDSMMRASYDAAVASTPCKGKP